MVKAREELSSHDGPGISFDPDWRELFGLAQAHLFGPELAITLGAERC